MKMSPDAVGQIAFQLSYMKLHGYPALCTSLARREDTRGRTETIRSQATLCISLQRQCYLMGINQVSELMYMAANRHVELAKELLLVMVSIAI